MEKNRLFVIVMCLSMCRAHRILTHGNDDTQFRQHYDKLKSNVFSSYIQNGNLILAALSTGLVYSLPSDENTASNAWRWRIMGRHFEAHNGEYTKRQSIVQFKLASRQGRKLLTDATDPWQQLSDKHGTKVAETNYHDTSFKEIKFIEQLWRKLQGSFHPIELQNAAQKTNRDNYINSYERPSLQKRNQYITFVHRVRKSVNESGNNSIKSSKGIDKFNHQQVDSDLSTKNTTSTKKTLGSTNSIKSGDKKLNSVKSYTVLQSKSSTSASNISNTSIHPVRGGSVTNQTHVVHTVTITSTLAPSTVNSFPSVSSYSTSKFKELSSTQSSFHSLGGNSHDDTSPVTNQSVTSASTSTSTSVQDISSVQLSTSIPKSDSFEQLQQNHSQSSIAGLKVTTSAQTSTSKSAQSTKSLLFKTESSIPSLSNSSQPVSTQEISSSTTSTKLTTLNGLEPNSSTTIITSPKTPGESSSEPSTDLNSSSEPISETSPYDITAQGSSPESTSARTSSPGPTTMINSPEPTIMISSPEPTTMISSAEPTTSGTSSPEPTSEISSAETTTSGTTSPEPTTSSRSTVKPSSSSSEGSNLEPETKTSHLESTTLSFVSSLSAKSLETIVDDVSKLATTKQLQETSSPVTVTTTLEQNSTSTPTVTRQTSASRDTQSNNIPTTKATISKLEVTTKREPIATPEPSPDKEPETENPFATIPPQSAAEPGPDWNLAKKKWSFLWEAHLYLFGGCFTLIGIFIIISLIRLWQIKRLLSRRYFFTLNMLILYCCVLRAFYLLFDGYNSNGSFPDILQYFLYNSVFPCLTSAFSILLFSLLTATQMQLVPPSIQKIKYLIIIIMIHFLIQITTDVVVGLSAGTRIMLFVCQLLYIIWGLFLFCGYAYVFRRLYFSAVKRQKTFQYITGGKNYMDDSETVQKKFTLSLAVKVTLVAAVFGLVTVVLEVFAIVSVYGIMSDKQPEAWVWWIYHTTLRFTECLMFLTMSYVASQPFRYKQKYKSCACFVLCTPCLEMFSCNQPVANDSIGWEDYDQLHLHTSVSRTNGHMNGKKVCLSDVTNIVPIVVQPSSSEPSRPTSLLIIEDGYVRFQTDHDINKIVDSYTGGPRQEMLTFRSGDGIINGAYMTIEDPFTFDRVSTRGYARRSSLASSEYFHPPSSLSLADSMDMEIDKAFRSMREHEVDAKTLNDSTSSCSAVARRAFKISDSVNGHAIEAYLEQQASRPVLRRSRSALGDISDEKRESLRKNLFRSRSDTSNCVRTKDLDNLKYFSLLDLEQQREIDERMRIDETFSGRYSSDDLFINNNSSPEDLKHNRGAAKRLLTNSSDSDIDV